MTSPPPLSYKMNNLSQEVAVDLDNPPPQSNVFGILDIRADSIKTPPHFTEEATILAMKNLGINSSDLVLLSSREDPASTVSDDIMRLKIINEMERKRFEAIEKVIAERNRIMMKGNIEVPIPKMIDEDENNFNKNNSNKTDKTQSSRKKKRVKGSTKSGRKKSKKKITNIDEMEFNDSENENLSSLNTRRRKKKSTRNSSRKFRSKKESDQATFRSNIPKPRHQNTKISTNRRPSVAERRQKYNSQRSKYPNGPNSNLRSSIRKNDWDIDISKKNNLLLINMRVKANEQRCQLEREEKHQIIKQQAQLRMQRLKGEETQFEKFKRDRKSKMEEEMKREERLYMRLQEKKMKAFEQDKKKRQQKIYNSKIKQDEINVNEARFSKLRQKILENQINNNNNMSNDDDLFSVTQPKNPKLSALPSNNLANSKPEPKSNTKTQNTTSVKHNRANSELINKEDNKLPKKTITNPSHPKPLLSSTLNPPPTKKPQMQQYAKARSSLQNKNSAYYKQLLKLPVVGKNKTKIPCLRR